ncbi:MAG: DNA mismatch endonuclease Vsr [Candidatus Omnitrophica bacterium]|nr:DNA mismatch endonuclease Vsr [Candidatus Omnitrophota bacterium]
MKNPRAKLPACPSARFDPLTPEQRRLTMSRVRSKDTRPEMVVRRLIHRMGFRFRLHRRDLPGNPDIVLSRFRCIVMVHGCFWHHHRCKHGRKIPRSNQLYWLPKIEKTVQRDKRNRRDLQRLGWSILTVWECQLKNKEFVRKRIERFLGDRQT